jgi:RNA polymerase sigma factor (sigma-70 family)
MEDALEPVLNRLAESRYDNAGWEQLYNTLWPVVVGTLTRRHGLPPTIADDLAQDVMIRLLRNARFSGVSAARFRAYVNKVCRSVAVDHRRASAKLGEEVALDEEVALFDPPMRSPYEQREAAAAFDSVVAGLPESSAKLLKQVLAGREAKEIASGLKVPVGTVYVWLHRLRRRLRDALGRSV